jgi:hypothetical protein
VKWSRAVHHLEALAETCTDMLTRSPDIYRIRVQQLWTFGEMLGAPTDIEWIPVALAIDLPPEDVPWLSEPVGTQHWANATRLNKNPFIARWRSLRAPIWNHDIERPVLFWDAENGPVQDALAALRDGDGERMRMPGPTEDELRGRIAAELAICLDSVRRCTATYTDRRWAPGKLTPVADALWQANVGYLDLLDASGTNSDREGADAARTDGSNG